MEERWSVNLNDLKLNKRTDGISGFIRARNEEDWLSLTIESHLSFLDEIIIVYNRCTDNTPEIANYYANKYPNQVKASHYIPKVFPQGSERCQNLPPTSENSLVNYYNYALCKTTRKIALKVDGDQIAIPSVYQKMLEYVRKCRPLTNYYTFRGINLWDEEGKVFIHGDGPITCHDRGFFVVNNSTWHTLDKKRALELFYGGNHPSKKVEQFAYYHTKGMKKDRGTGNYDLKDNPNSRYHGVVQKWWTKPNLITFKEFQELYPIAQGLPSPESLGLNANAR
jgi:glycosyltransferase involved in cell wall biosynthesis